METTTFEIKKVLAAAGLVTVFSLSVLPATTSAYGGASFFTLPTTPVACKTFRIPLFGRQVQLCTPDTDQMDKNLKDRFGDFFTAVREKPGINLSTR